MKTANCDKLRSHRPRALTAALIFGFVLATLASPPSAAAATADPTLDWAVSAGGPNSDAGNRVAVDADGNAVVTGRFSGAATFGASDQQVTLTSAGGDDVFLARYNAEGTLDWVVSAGGTGSDVGFDVEVDAGGAAVVTGQFSGAATFGASDQQVTLTSAGGDDVFLARYAVDGTLDWVVSAGGTARDRDAGLAVDDDGNAVITGFYQYDATFGTGDEQVTLTGDWPYGGSVTNVFVARYRNDGTLD